MGKCKRSKSFQAPFGMYISVIFISMFDQDVMSTGIMNEHTEIILIETARQSNRHSASKDSLGAESDVLQDPTFKLNVDSTQGDDAPLRTDDDGAIIVSWDGDDDKENPLNWSPKKMTLIASTVSLIGFMSPLSSAISSPGAAGMAAEFGSDSSVVISMITAIFVLGSALGPLVFAPASEIYGRAPLFHASNIAFVAFTLGCALASSIPQLIAFRFLAGCASSGQIIAGGVIGDMIPVDQRGKYLGIVAVGSLVGPIIGPIAGGYLTLSISWRWSFWIVVIIGGLVTTFAFLAIRETHAPTILKRKVARLQKENPDVLYRAEGAVAESAGAVMRHAFVRPLKMLFCQPAVLVLTLFQALCNGYEYLLFTTFPAVFNSEYGFSAALSSLTFLGFGLGSVVGLFLVLSVGDKWVQREAARSPSGEAKPEMRVTLMTYGAFLLPIGLFWYGWSAHAHVHWIVPILGTFVLVVGSMFIGLIGFLYLIDCYVAYAASALAAITLVQSILGAFLPLAGGPMYQALGLGLGNSVLGFIALAFCIVPPLLARYGERVRNRFSLDL